MPCLNKLSENSELICLLLWIKYTSVISRHFCKGKQLLDFLFASPGDETPLKWVYSLRKEFAPKGANSILKELTRVEKEAEK